MYSKSSRFTQLVAGLALAWALVSCGGYDDNGPVPPRNCKGDSPYSFVKTAYELNRSPSGSTVFLLGYFTAAGDDECVLLVSPQPYRNLKESDWAQGRLVDEFDHLVGPAHIRHNWGASVPLGAGWKGEQYLHFRTRTRRDSTACWSAWVPYSYHLTDKDCKSCGPVTP